MGQLLDLIENIFTSSQINFFLKNCYVYTIEGFLTTWGENYPNSQNNSDEICSYKYIVSSKIRKKLDFHCGPENLKKSKQKKSWYRIDPKKISWNCIFGSFKLFPCSKFDFCPFLKLQKIEFGQKFYLISQVFFCLHFLNFLAHCVLQDLLFHSIVDTTISYYIKNFNFFT